MIKVFSLLLFLSMFRSVLCAEYYEFPIAWDDSVYTDIDMSRRLKDKPAGKHGHIVSSGSDLVFEDGTAVKFWGVNVAFSSKTNTSIPPEKDIAEALVAKWKKYGINHVRFIGFDGNAPEVYKKLKNCKKCENKTLDKFDYLIYVLRKEGIYYSISINNNSNLQLDMVEGLLKNKNYKTYKKYKYVRLYDEKSVNVIEEWFELFYSHKNKYTGLTYAEDPANIYVTAVNEDSIFYPYHHNFSLLTDENVERLTALFNVFLKKKYVNTGYLKKSWSDNKKLGLLPIESLEDSDVSIVTQRMSRLYSKQRVVDTMQFLYDVDAGFSKRIKAVLEKLKYKGLFTSTNNWNGYGSLVVAKDVGNFIASHGYIDPPRTSKNDKKITIIKNESYLTDPLSNSAKRDSNPLFSSFVTALEDKPFILSEWNHTIWSDYSYEGLALVTLYSAFQGYSGLNAFNYFDYPNPDPKSEHLLGSYSLGGNPVFLSLSPSLSLAFQKNYIKSPDKAHVITYAKDMDDYLKFVAEQGISRTNGIGSYPLDVGFSYKIRKRLIGDKSPVKLKINRNKDIHISSTGQIVWDHSDKNKSTLMVSADKFQLLVGYLKQKLTSVKSDIVDRGVVSVISLDDIDLIDSNMVLLTVVGSQKNTGMEKQLVIGEGYSLTKTGTSPVLLKRILGTVSFITKNSKTPSIKAIMADGLSVDVPYIVNKIGDESSIVVNIGNINTPWYVIKFE